MGNVMTEPARWVTHISASVLQFLHKINFMKCVIRQMDVHGALTARAPAAICNYVCMQQFIATTTTASHLINVLRESRASKFLLNRRHTFTFTDCAHRTHSILSLNRLHQKQRKKKEGKNVKPIWLYTSAALGAAVDKWRKEKKKTNQKKHKTNISPSNKIIRARV